MEHKQRVRDVFSLEKDAKRWSEMYADCNHCLHGFFDDPFLCA